ncbi:predicted protein [Coccidioides posadasii str. Silveira]|uniref:Predicted protein n=1 Tax=Coccidioides posadasii (strain RMSCC 757 / Silveira) TaxID=443226 RepID=E9DEV5_COCPS|nr:predicted protein [Coccidioides posadasii str. Silveira]
MAVSQEALFDVDPEAPGPRPQEPRAKLKQQRWPPSVEGWSEPNFRATSPSRPEAYQQPL